MNRWKPAGLRAWSVAWLLLSCLTVAAAAQTSPIQLARVHPDFSGTWTLVRNEIARAPGAKDPLSMFTFGPSVSIVQTSSALQIAIWQVRLDGTATTDTDGSTVSGAWDGDALVLTEREPSPGGASSEHRVVLRLLADGTLTIEVTSTPVQDVVSVRSIYQRAAGSGAVGSDGVFTPGRGVTSPVLTHEEKPAYTRPALLAGIHGIVELDVTVLPDGSVDPATVTVTKSLDARLGLDDSAIAAAKLWRFRPAVQQSTGTPVPCRVSIVMTFKLGGD